jgi:dihydropyrimidinase
MATARRVDTLVAGGTVATGDGAAVCDVAIRDGRIVRLTDPALRPEAAEYVDARGKVVIPGVIDAHTHFRATGATSADTLRDLTVSAAHGGVTTLLGFAQGDPGESLPAFLARLVAEGRRGVATDFGLHAILLPSRNDVDQIPEATRLGVTSFKMFMTYRPSGRMFTDDKMLRAMAAVGRAGGLAQVHCENGDVIDYLVEQSTKAGRVHPRHFPPTQPGYVEVEAINRAAMLAEVADCRLYVVHITTPEGLDAAVAARARRGRVHTETLPKYLVLDDAEMERQGPLAKIGPPLRPAETLPRMWARVQAGLFDVIASDHAPYPAETKQAGWENVFGAAFGAPGTETLLPVVYSEGVAAGRITVSQLVRMLCEAPARIFGLYPRKGTLQVGADADLVVIDPDAEWTVAAANQHSNAGYTLYEGRRLRGRPVRSLLRGKPLLKDGQLASTDAGQYLARSPAAAPATV